MVGTDDAHMMGDWAAPPNPTPMTLMSSILNSEEFGPKPPPDFLAKNEPPPLGGRMPKMEVVAKVEKVEPGFDFSKQSNLFGDQKATSSHKGGGLGGRRAANGFNLPMINTELAGQPTMASPTPDLLTIPPGFSPTSLLESPVFLSNSLMLPSPTTGKLLFNNSGNVSSFPIPNVLKTGDEIFQDVPEAFAFKPPLDPNLSFLLHSERRVALTFDQQHSFPSIKISQSENPMQTGSLEDGGANLQNQTDSNLHGDHKDISDNVTANQRMSDSSMDIEHSLPPDDQQDCEADQKEILSAAVGTPAEDGYNWRKYGQKQVKGSEYPRSYYKCTHLNCQVKKKVERSHEGHITEIIYKGGHNHPKPPPNRRSGVLSSQPLNDQQIDGTEQPGSQSSFDGKSTWVSTQNNGGQDWRNDGLEETSPCIGTGELCDPFTTTVQQPQDGIRMSSDALDVSSTMSNEEDEDDRATHGSISAARDGDEDDTETKRRKLEACAIEMSAASRAVREPRVVVQTISEVDILDDGYRWRKYGQKVVKGNPNPRSYYKCTNPGCTVRKHVERASHDLKSVITTYEGKHNHDVPAARNSNHPNSASSNTSATSTPQTHSLMRTEPTQDGLVRFESHASIGGYGLAGREQFGPPTSYSVAMGQMGQPGLTNLAMAGLGPMAPIKIPVLPPVHGYMGVHHQPPEGGFMVPKGEPKEETMPGSRLPMEKGGSVYHQMMSRMPLGPQL